MTPTVWVLDRGEPSAEGRLLCDALAERGIGADTVDWTRLIAQGFPDPSAGRPALPDLALVRPRVLNRHEGDLALLYDWLGVMEDGGTRVLNTVHSLRRTKNKVWQAALLAGAGVPVPDTRTVRTLDEIARCLADWGEIVLKPVHGHASLDVTRMAALGPERRYRDGSLGLREETVGWHLLRRYGELCAQRFLPSPGRELRVIVVGGRVVVCSYHRTAELGAAVQGARVLMDPARWEPHEPDAALLALVGRALGVLGLDLASLDLVETPAGHAVIEVNPTVPSWRFFTGTEHDRTGGRITEIHTDLVIDRLKERGVGI
jgi:tetrahydromethanopterin:alpha-L-glutamate ligase